MSTSFKGSLKLAAILDLYPQINISGMICSDLGCNVGGFTKELLDRGAQKVHAVDCGYGTLDWNLRNDPRVVVKERQNALHADYLKDQDCIVIDVAWTKQAHILPAAFSYLSKDGVIFSLLKTQYEIDEKQIKKKKKILSEEESAAIAQRVFEDLEVPNTHSKHLHQSPIKGGKDRKGNTEFWLALQPKK